MRSRILLASLCVVALGGIAWLSQAGPADEKLTRWEKVAGGVYRTLRSLERLGLVRSEWQTSAVGPARRTYYITPEGVHSLEAQADGLRHTDEALHVFLERYARVVAAERRGCPEGSRDDYRGEGNGSANRVRPPRSADRRARH